MTRTVKTTTCLLVLSSFAYRHISTNGWKNCTYKNRGLGVHLSRRVKHLGQSTGSEMNTLLQSACIGRRHRDAAEFGIEGGVERGLRCLQRVARAARCSEARVKWSNKLITYLDVISSAHHSRARQPSMATRAAVLVCLLGTTGH